MTIKLQCIDHSILDHPYLTNEDECFFYGEYTSGEGYSHSDMNSLIFNFKKSLERKGGPDWSYKKQTIKKVAQIFTSLQNWEELKTFTWVPIPPSKHKKDPLYDNRLVQTLKLMKEKEPTFDYRELVNISQSRPSAHKSNSRPTPEEHYNNYEIDKNLINPHPKTIVIYDDVITTGASYKAMKRLLGEFFDAKILGLFIARTQSLFSTTDQEDD